MINFIPNSLNQAIENLISPIRIFHPDNFARTLIGNLGFANGNSRRRNSNFKGSNSRVTLDDEASENVDKNLNINKNNKDGVSDRLIERIDTLINITERNFDKNHAVLSSIFEVLTNPPSKHEEATHEPSIEAMQAFELYRRETDNTDIGNTGGSSFMHFSEEAVKHKKNKHDRSTGVIGDIGGIVKDVIEGMGLLAVGASLKRLLSAVGRFLPRGGEPLPKPPPPEPTPTPSEGEPLPKPPPPEPTPPELDKNGRLLPPRDSKGRFTKKVTNDVSKSSIPESEAGAEAGAATAEGEAGVAAGEAIGVETGAEVGALAVPGLDVIAAGALLGTSLYNLGSNIANSGTKADKKLRSIVKEVNTLENKNKNIQQTLKYLVDAHGDQSEITHYVHEYGKNKEKIDQLKKEEPHYRSIVGKEFDDNYKTPFLSDNNNVGLIGHSQSLIERYSSPVTIHNDNRVTHNHYNSATNNSTGEGSIKTYHTSPADSGMITPTTGR